MKLVTVKEIKENDIILDREGLELVVKKIETCNKKYFVTVNYKESGFYKVVDTTKKMSGNQKVYRA